MIILYEKFSRGIRWNALESIVYQISFVGHQVILFATIDHALYGLVGTLFSLLYLIIGVANLGLDASLAPFFTAYTSSKKRFRHILGPHIMGQIALLLVISLLFYGASSYCAHIFTPLALLTSPMIALLSVLIFFEGIKKTVRTILQLAFLNHITACIDILTITGYISLVWLWFFLGFQLTLMNIFAPMLLISILGTLVLTWFLAKFYQQLPDTPTQAVPLPVNSRFIKSRFFNYLTQLSHLLFSANLLVPLFATHFGLSTAGIFKLVSTLSHSVTLILNKIFGLTTEALLAQVKEMDLDTKRDVFATITSRLHEILYCIILFFVINHNIIVSLYGATPSDSAWLLASLFFVISISEYFFMTYEKFYTAEEQAHRLFIFNMITVGSLMYALHCTLVHGPLITLVALLVVRILSFLSISSLSFYTWRLKPTLFIQPSYLVTTLGLSLTFFLLTR